MDMRKLLALAGGMCLWLNATGLCQPAPKIGYISLKKVSEESLKKKAFEEEVRKLVGEGRDQRDALRKEITDLETALTLSGPEQAKKTEQQIGLKKRELEKLIQERNRRIQQMSLTFERVILEDIGTAVQEIAKEKGYTWVLVDEILLYKDESADLTFQVLVKMNEKYLANRPAEEPPPKKEQDPATIAQEPLSMAEEDALVQDVLKNGVQDRYTIKEIQPRNGSPSGSVTMKSSARRVQFVAQYPKDMTAGDGLLSAPMGNESVWRFAGKVPLSGYTFEGPDENLPLAFILVEEIGLVHLHGKGKVTFPDGKTVSLGEKEAL